MAIAMAPELQALLIALFTPRKIIAYVVVLAIIVVAVVWFMNRSRRSAP